MGLRPHSSRALLSEEAPAWFNALQLPFWILNNFIFEFIFCKWSLMGQWSMNTSRGDTGLLSTHWAQAQGQATQTLSRSPTSPCLSTPGCCKSGPRLVAETAESTEAAVTSALGQNSGAGSSVTHGEGRLAHPSSQYTHIWLTDLSLGGSKLLQRAYSGHCNRAYQGIIRILQRVLNFLLLKMLQIANQMSISIEIEIKCKDCHNGQKRNHTIFIWSFRWTNH